MTSSEKSFNRSIQITSDKIFSDSIFINQSKQGYRFNSDSMILSWFIFQIIQKRKLENALEIGSGSGVIPIVLTYRGAKLKTCCVEIQSSLFSLLKKNISQNGLADILTPFNGSFFDVSLPYKKFDIIYTNPPYFPPDRGRISPEIEKAQAKHEFSGSLKDFFIHSANYLKKKGMFIFIYPVSRIQYALSCAAEAGYFLKDLYLYRENSIVSPSLFTANMIFDSGVPVSRTELITIRNDDGSFTPVGNEIMYDKN